MAVASTVTVNFKAETAKFDSGLKKAKKNAGGFGKAMASAFKVAAAATTGLVIGLSALTKASLATVDSQRKVARTIGTTQRVLAGLTLAAEISGVSVTSFEKALKKQQKAIVDANDGLQTQARAFQRLGLSTKDLLNLPVEDQFKQITTALAKVENATKKVAIASDIFGSKNSDLINVLELGEAGLDSYIKKVEDLGVALTDKQTKAIEDANDAILLAKTAFVGLGNQLAARLAPAIIKVAQVVENLVARVTAAIPKFVAWASSILGVQRALDSLTVADLEAELAQINKEIGDFVDLRDDAANINRQRGVGNEDLGKLALIDQYNASIDKLVKRSEDAKKALQELRETGEVVVPDPVGGDTDNTGDLVAKQWQRDFDAATKSVATASEKLQTKLAEIRENLATNPLWSEELAGKQAAQAVEAYLVPFRQIQDAQEAAIQSQKDAAESATRAVATPAEALAYRIAEIRADLENNPYWKPETARRQSKEAVDAYLEEMKRIKDESENTFSQINEFQKQAARNLQDSFAQFLFDPFAEGLDGMLKGFGNLLRQMVAQLLAQQILLSFFGLFPGSSFAKAVVGNITGKASGGLVSGGTPYIVGESGPELFVPGGNGTIVPNGAGGGGNTFNFSTVINNDGELDAATLIPILEENNYRLKSEFLDELDRGAFS